MTNAKDDMCFHIIEKRLKNSFNQPRVTFHRQQSINSIENANDNNQ